MKEELSNVIAYSANDREVFTAVTQSPTHGQCLLPNYILFIVHIESCYYEIMTAQHKYS